MMGFDQWWEEFESVHPDWRYADSDALRKAAWEAGVDSEIVKRWEGNCIASEEAREQLAAAQAREGVLRDFIFDYTEIEPNNEAMIARYDTCVKPTDDTALKAALAAERERCAKFIEGIYNRDTSLARIADDIAKRIRALGD